MNPIHDTLFAGLQKSLSLHFSEEELLEGLKLLSSSLHLEKLCRVGAAGNLFEFLGDKPLEEPIPLRLRTRLESLQHIAGNVKFFWCLWSVHWKK